LKATACPTPHGDFDLYQRYSEEFMTEQNLNFTHEEKAFCPYCNSAIILSVVAKNLRFDTACSVQFPGNGDACSAQDQAKTDGPKFTKYARRLPNLAAFGMFRKALLGPLELFTNGQVAFSSLERHEILKDAESCPVDLSDIMRFWSINLPAVFPITATGIYVRMFGKGVDVTCFTRDVDLAFALYPDAAFSCSTESQHIFVMSEKRIVGLIMSAEHQATFWPEL
jgi:hypothetical protein